MNKHQERLERQRKEIEGLSQNKCWVHGNELIRGITESSYGLPSGYALEIQYQFPYHGLFVDLGCLAVPSDQTQGQTTNICPTCQKEAIVYLDSIEDEEEE